MAFGGMNVSYAPAKHGLALPGRNRGLQNTVTADMLLAAGQYRVAWHSFSPQLLQGSGMPVHLLVTTSYPSQHGCCTKVQVLEKRAGGKKKKRTSGW